MIYAKLVINTKTTGLKDYFYYKVPADILAYIKKWDICEVPFKNKIKLGLIVGFTKRISFPANKAKSIKKINYNIGNYFSKYHFKLAEKISSYYLKPIGEVIFFMVPKLSKKYKLENSFKFKFNKKSQILTCYNYKKDRFRIYKNLIEKVFLKGKSVLLLVPDMNANLDYVNNLKQTFANTVVIDKISVVRRTSQINEILEEKPKLVIGTRNSIFNIPTNIGLVVIDDYSNFGYKEEQTIHYNCFTVAVFIKEIFGCNILFGDIVPKIAQIAKFPSLSSRKVFIGQEKVRIALSQDYKTLNYKLESAIKKVISGGKKILILSNSNDTGLKLICSDCGHVFTCEKCDTVYHTRNNKLYCPSCKNESKYPNKCSVCSSFNLKEYGWTTKKITQIIQNLKLKHQTVNKPNDAITENIVVSTNYILSFGNLSFDYIFVNNWEIVRNKGVENMTRILYTLSEIAKEKVIIISYLEPDKELGKILANNWKEAFLSDLQKRKTYNFFPYFRTIRFYKKSNKDESKIFFNLEKNLSSISLKNDIIKHNIRSANESIYNLYVKINNENFIFYLRKLAENYEKFRLGSYNIDFEIDD